MTSRCRHDALVAFALAAVLSFTWAWRDWANLAQLRLPDTDDVMRLQQIRDWLAGQSWFDLAQHRLGTGLQMHWSRLADLVPGVMIAGLTPLIGQHGAELTAVIASPAFSFGTALFLVVRIARSLGGDILAVPAAIVAAIAYPATTIFLPGRIDHHGLQIVLLLAALLGMLGQATPLRRALAGAAAAASLVIGMETAPLLGVLGVVALADWIAGTDRDGEALAGFAVGAFAGLVVGRIGFAGSGWDYPACDGFTAVAWTAAMTLAAAPILLAGLSGVATTLRARAIAAAAVVAIAAALALVRSPACVAPYGGVDPLLARLWLEHVGEAQSILAADIATTLGYTGVMIAGLGATLWRCRTGERGWRILAALQLAAFAITAVQLRGAYVGAMLAAPGLAALIVAARRRGGVRLAGAWLASAGMLYPIAANALTPTVRAHPSKGRDCESPAAIAALARLAPGRVLAPIDAGPWILAATHHRVIAAPYHRNGAADLAMYRFYGARPHAAAAVADQWRVDYVMVCANMSDAAVPSSTAAALATGALPGFIIRLRARDGTAIFTRNRLSKPAPAL